MIRDQPKIVTNIFNSLPWIKDVKIVFILKHVNKSKITRLIVINQLIMLPSGQPCGSDLTTFN